MASEGVRMTTPAERRDPKGSDGHFGAPGRDQVGNRGILSEKAFHEILALERRRSERSRKPFVLLLLQTQPTQENGNGARSFERLTTVLSEATRETDVLGWYEQSAILAAIFTEVNQNGKGPITDILYSKVSTILRDNVDAELLSKLIITVHLFPEDWDRNHPERVANTKLYPDLEREKIQKRNPTQLKRGVDVLVSSVAFLMLSPILAAIAVAIKLTSKGPIIFRQQRLGQFATTFECLKFRTMYVDNDPKIHREFVQSFITGKTEQENKKEGKPHLYKITNDPRITPIGKLLRKASLDELPQLWNVLRGEMSLVGPRPPLPYEFQVYDIWHRRRVLEVKPGVTGLWQISGRSRTSFDDMVRLDLRYVEKWSLWLDFKILLATPRAVFTGNGAV